MDGLPWRLDDLLQRGTNKFRPLSYWPLGLLKDRQRTRLQKELKLEEIRRDFYPHQVSRLHGLYLWGDEASAVRGQQRWGTAAGTYFHPDYLVELSFTYSAMSQVDTTWIDECLMHDSIPFDKDNVDWMHRYWKGEAYPNSDPLWEYIVKGRGVICGTVLRTKAYEVVRQHAPLSLGRLELGRIAVELGSDLYHIAPFIRRIDGTKFVVAYYGDERQQNDGFMHALGSHIAQSDRSLIRWEAIALLQGTTHRLDLRHMSFGLDSSEFVDDPETFARAIVSEYDGTVWTGLSDPPNQKENGQSQSVG